MEKSRKDLRVLSLKCLILGVAAILVWFIPLNPSAFTESFWLFASPLLQFEWLIRVALGFIGTTAVVIGTFLYIQAGFKSFPVSRSIFQRNIWILILVVSLFMLGALNMFRTVLAMGGTYLPLLSLTLDWLAWVGVGVGACGVVALIVVPRYRATLPAKYLLTGSLVALSCAFIAWAVGEAPSGGMLSLGVAYLLQLLLWWFTVLAWLLGTSLGAAYLITAPSSSVTRDDSHMDG